MRRLPVRVPLRRHDDPQADNAVGCVGRRCQLEATDAYPRSVGVRRLPNQLCKKQEHRRRATGVFP